MNLSQPNPFADGAAYVDGEFTPVADARIPLLDTGFLRSDTTYDVAHVWKGRFFRLDDHLDRFLAGAAKLRFELPMGKAEIAAMLHRLVALSGLTDAYVNVTASRGTLPKGIRNPLASIRTSAESGVLSCFWSRAGRVPFLIS